MWMHDSAVGQPPVMDPRYPGLGQRLRQAIEDAGTNPHRLSKELKIAYTTVDAWLREESAPRAHNLQLLAEVLGRSVEWLMNGDQASSRSEELYSSLTGFLASISLSADERQHLESIRFAFGDPGEHYWPQALSSYRAAKRFKEVETLAASSSQSSTALLPVKKKPRP